MYSEILTNHNPGKGMPKESDFNVKNKWVWALQGVGSIRCLWCLILIPLHQPTHPSPAAVSVGQQQLTEACFSGALSASSRNTLVDVHEALYSHE